MSLTYNGKVIETADAIADAATRVRDAVLDLRAILAFNSNRAIDWNGDPLPSYISEDADGNLLGRKFSRAEVANAVGTLATISTAVTAGDLGNLNKLADAPK